MAAVVAGLLLIASAMADGTKVGAVTVLATGFTNEKGMVLIQLANSAEDYDRDDTAFRHAELKVDGDRVTHVFEDVPYGEYAIKIFHDENGNRKIDMGWRGPTERYGFSNDARGLLGPPGFEAAKFEVAARAMEVEIHVK